MSLIHNQIEAIKAIFQKHEKYHHFSGLACIIVGILWLLNEVLNYQMAYPDYYRILSWIAVAILAIIIAAVLTIRERKKRNKMITTLAIKEILYKLALICLGTFALMWVFYQLIALIPTLFMLMYGLLILTSKQNLPIPIQYFGYASFIAGIVGFFFAQYIIGIAALVLGLGHIIIGLTLIIHDKQYS